MKSKHETDASVSSYYKNKRFMTLALLPQNSNKKIMIFPSRNQISCNTFHQNIPLPNFFTVLSFSVSTYLYMWQ